jgi:Na+/proline symporter
MRFPRLPSSQFAWALRGSSSFILASQWVGFTYVVFDALHQNNAEDGRQTFMGVILGSAVVPIALCITWSRANKWGCIGGAVAGFFAGLIAWLVTTSSLNGGVINVTTSGGDYEMLAGNLASIGVGGIIAVAASYIVNKLPFLL